MSDVSFEFGDQGAPNLVGEGEPAPTPQDLPGEALVAVPSWTPDEAAAKVAEILTTGILIGYVARHSALPTTSTLERLVFQGAEFPSTGTAMVPFLNRFVPRGGLADVGISASAALGEISMAVAKRFRPFREKPPGTTGPAAAAEPAPAEAAPAAAASDGQPAGSGYRLPRDLVPVVKERASEALGGLGVPV